jgi:DNA-binding transcriptional LysR family regulator
MTSLGGLDLNLLRTLQALLDTRNVTRAGERLHLSQPATSAALAKLRRHFDDELLVRVGREMQLTPLAQTLLPLASEALVHVERTFDVRAQYDASVSDRRFSVHASDYATCMVNEPLRRLLSREAPGTSVQFSPPPREHLASGITTADLLVAPVGFGMAGPHDVVLRDHFVVIVSRAHVPDPDDCDVVKLLKELPHAVAVFGDDVVTPADRLLEQLDVPRKVAATVNGFVPLPMLVRGTDLVAMVPFRLARMFADLGEIAVLDVPGAESTPLIEAIYWDPSRTADPALQWLRGAFVRACEPLSRHDTA